MLEMQKPTWEQQDSGVRNNKHQEIIRLFMFIPQVMVKEFPAMLSPLSLLVMSSLVGLLSLVCPYFEENVNVDKNADVDVLQLKMLYVCIDKNVHMAGITQEVHPY